MHVFLQLFLDAARTPEIRWIRSCVLYVSGISGSFWLLSWILNVVAVTIHDSLWEELSETFAILYNLSLAILFASVIHMAALDAGKRGGAPFLFMAVGFVFVYAVLKVLYTDDVYGRINDYAILGFVGGLATYLIGAAIPRWMMNPVTMELYRATVWMAGSWIGVALSAYGAYRVARFVLLEIRDIVTSQPRIKVRRA